MGQAIITLGAAVLVLVLCYMTTRRIGRSIQSGARAKYMTVIDRLPIGTDRYLMVVKTGKRCFLLGVSPGQITRLAELEEEELVSYVQANDGREQEFKKIWDVLQEGRKQYQNRKNGKES